MIDLSKSNFRISVFLISRPQPQPQLDTISAELLFLGRPSQLPVQGSFGDFLSLNECTTLVSRSVFPLDCEQKSVVATDSTQFPGGQNDPTFAAACLLLLNAPGIR